MPICQEELPIGEIDRNIETGILFIYLLMLLVGPPLWECRAAILSYIVVSSRSSVHFYM